MRLWLAALFALAVGAAPMTAAADSYYWGGTVGSFTVTVEVFGSSEGTHGWELQEARRFATWGAHIDASIPAGHRVAAVLGLDDDTFWLEVRDADKHVLARLPTSVERLGDSGYDALHRVLIAHFDGDGGTTPLVDARIYTVQLAATTDEEAAIRHAQRLREREVRAEGSFYYETCAPCFATDPKVQDGKVEGRVVFRVVTGIFNSWSAARRARDHLERETGRRGFMRRL